MFSFWLISLPNSSRNRKRRPEGVAIVLGATALVGRGTAVFYFDARPNCFIGGQPGAVVVEHFIPPVLVGCAECTEVPSTIRSSAYPTHDASILAYYSSAATNNLDNFTTAQMESLARAMLKEGALHTDKVGGGVQVIVFPTSGKPSESMPPLPSTQSFVPDMAMRTACSYSPEFPTGKALPGSRQSMFVEAKNWGDAPISQYFLASEFENVSVTLDNNYFVGDTFNSVTFKYFGSKQRSKKFRQPAFVVLRSTFLGKRCRLELLNGIKLPPRSGLDRCDISRVKMGVEDDHSIGHPVQAKTSGQVRKREDGGITVTTGTKPGSVASMSLPAMGLCQ